MIEHRELLKKYIEHVREYEGVDFLGLGYEEPETFTAEEWAELKTISEEPNE